MSPRLLLLSDTLHPLRWLPLAAGVFFGIAANPFAAEPTRLEFADGRVVCEVFPAGDNRPDQVLSVLPVAMRVALSRIGPPPVTSSLAVRLQPPPPFHQRVLSMFRDEPLATQQGDDILLQPGTDPLRLAFRIGHELSHWLVAKQHPVRPPLWLDEGLANIVGAAAAEAVARPLSQTVHRPLPPRLAPNLFTLEELVALDAYPRRPDRSAAFYWQAEALVKALHEKLGPAEFNTYLAWMSSPHPPPWEAPLREQWYFNDWDFGWFARQIQPPDSAPPAP